MFERPEIFHTQYLWTENIQYKIHNPEVSCEWIEEINEKNKLGDVKSSYLVDVVQESGWRDLGMAIINAYHSFKRKKRLKDFDLLTILACPKCLGDLSATDKMLTCSKCNSEFFYKNGIPDFS